MFFSAVVVPRTAGVDRVEFRSKPSPGAVALCQTASRCQPAGEFARSGILCGDSTSPGDVMRLTTEVVPVLMTTDPPYRVSYDPELRDRRDGSPRGEDALPLSLLAIQR